MSAGTDTLMVSGIECLVGGRRVVIARDAIDQIVECTVARVPLARTWIGGMAAHEDGLVVSVRLAAPRVRGEEDEREEEKPTGITKAVLLATRAEGQTRWSVEIDAVTTFVDARVPRSNLDHGSPEDEGRAPWLVAAQTSDGDVDWLDVDRMLRELADTRES